jgi:soluble lytic murein transglycosylase-like protein
MLFPKTVLASSPYDTIINSLAFRHRINAGLIHSIIKAESNYDPFAVSHKGACGLMQLMPDTARDLGVKNIYDPYENVQAGIKYFKKLLKDYEGNTKLALAAYNAGPEAVKKYGGIPPYPETQRYIKKVNDLYRKKGGRRVTKIYSFYNKSGKLVLTNIPHLQRKRWASKSSK